jgi:hypothetical protein
MTTSLPLLNKVWRIRQKSIRVIFLIAKLLAGYSVTLDQNCFVNAGVPSRVFANQPLYRKGEIRFVA